MSVRTKLSEGIKGLTGVVIGARLLQIGSHRYLAELRRDVAKCGSRVQFLMSEVEAKINNEMTDIATDAEAVKRYETCTEMLTNQWGNIAEVVENAIGPMVSSQDVGGTEVDDPIDDADGPDDVVPTADADEPSPQRRRTA